MIAIKRVYDPPAPEDGLRILCTGRWPRGVRRDSVDLWWPQLGTPPELLRDWLADRVSPEEFRARMGAALRTAAATECIDELVSMTRRGDLVTLLTSVRDMSKTHLSVVLDIVTERLTDT